MAPETNLLERLRIARESAMTTKKLSSDFYLMENRLQYVIGLIQAMAVRRRYKLPAKEWHESVFSAAELTLNDFLNVLEQHPECFRRATSDKTEDKTEDKTGDKTDETDDKTDDEANEKADDEAEPISGADPVDKVTREMREWSLVYRRFIPKGPKDLRRPLEPAEVKMLVDIATSLHSKQYEREEDRKAFRRALIPAGASLIGAFAGAAAALFAASYKEKSAIIAGQNPPAITAPSVPEAPPAP